MKKKVELPLTEPVYSTHHNGLYSALTYNNPSIRNWYLNNIMILVCNRKFLSGYTTPEINILGLRLGDNPYLESHGIPMRFLNGYILPVIRNLIDQGYYIHFTYVDDYYVEGKSWYKKRHFNHDGGICGYDQENKTLCLYAYDSNWIYRKFWTSQKSFEKGRKAAFRNKKYGRLWGIRAKNDQVEFSPSIAISKISEYLDKDIEKYPEDAEGNVYGIAVHDYIAKYLDKLFDGSIPYDRMDWRIIRMIWEHKKIMLERIIRIEECCNLTSDLSNRYRPLVRAADNIRMQYASHAMRRRDKLLPLIKDELLRIKKEERLILSELILKTQPCLKAEEREKVDFNN